MRFQDFINSQAVVRLGVLIGQRMPRWVGHGVTRCMAAFLLWRQPELYWIVRSNLSRVLGPTADHKVLHRAVYEVFCHAGQAYYDLFRAIVQPASTRMGLVSAVDTVLSRLNAQLAEGRGVLLVGPHVSNFNLAILAMAEHGLTMQVLSLPDPGPGHAIVNRLLIEAGIPVTPISPGSLRAAIRRLGAGGLVFTGADYPAAEGAERVSFFGEPALLPMGPARLALLARVPIVVGACYWDRGRGYVMEITEPLSVQGTSGRQMDVLDCARRIAEAMELFVHAHPTQWLMFQRIWPGP